MNLQQIIDRYPDQDFLKADGLDDAILGVDEDSGRLIYSVAKCVRILQEDMNYDDALDYFGFNVQGAYVGKLTPIWCWDL